MMKAKVGDHLVIKGRRVHHPIRDAEILEVRGPDGQPPFLARWSDSDHVTLIFPGSDARIEPGKPSPAAADSTLGPLGGRARAEGGQPTLTAADAVQLVRTHIDLEKLRTTDDDREIWILWQDEVSKAETEAHNADVLDRVLARLRVGE